MTPESELIPAKGLIIVVGPTGSGKSALAMEVAEKYRLAIVSADSRQIYRGMEIGTDAPTIAERQRVPHYFVGCLSPDTDYSAFDYAREALPVIDREIEEKGAVLVVGGSALYIKALLYQMDDIPPVSEVARQKVELLYEKEGLEGVRERLRELDPDYLSRVDQNNYRRLIRALQVSESAGRPFSSFHSGTKRQFPFPVTIVYIDRKREELYERINQRVVQMIDRGLVEEVMRLESYRETNALRTIGYQEIFGYLYGRHDLKESVSLIQKNTRNFARHQITSFKHFSPDITIRL